MSWIRRGAGVSALALTMWAGCAQAGILDQPAQHRVAGAVRGACGLGVKVSRTALYSGA